MTPEQIENTKSEMIDSIKSKLPKPNSMVENAINMCLDNINRGYEVAHYQEVLKKLSQISRDNHAKKTHY